MNDKTLITTYNGVDIYIEDETGKFLAKAESNWLTAPSLAEIKRRIQPREGAEIKAFAQPHWSWDNSVPNAELLVGIDARGNYRVKGGNPRGGSHLDRREFYHWDDELVAKIKALQMRKKISDAAFEREYRALIKTARRVTASDFKRAVKQKPAEAEQA